MRPSTPHPRTRSHATRRSTWVFAAFLCLCLLGGISWYVLDTNSIVQHDAYGYAKNSKWLHEVWRGLFHPTGTSGSFFEHLGWVIEVTADSPRPPFYLPATILAAAFDLDWSVDLIVLLDLWIYFPILAFCSARIVYLFTNQNDWAALATICALVLSPVLWESSSHLMGDMPVTAITALLALAWIALIQNDGWSDYLFLGFVLAWGLLTKPVFIFFASPVVLHVAFWFVRKHWIGADEARGRWRSTTCLLITIAVPLTVLIWTWERLSLTIREIHLMNETLRVYLSSANLWEDATWPLVFSSESWVIYSLCLLAMLWISALFHRRGRQTWIVVGLLLAYVCLRLNQRSGRVFEPFLVGFACLTGFGAAALPERIAKGMVGMLSLCALLACLGFLTNDEFLNRTVSKRTVVCGHVRDDGSLGFWTWKPRPPLKAVGDEYEAYKIDEVFWITKVMEKPEVRVFLTFGGDPLNSTSFESKRRLGKATSPENDAFIGNGYRFGGFGAPGGLHPMFAEADYVLAKTGNVMSASADADLYYRLLSGKLMRDESPFHAGLERIADLSLPGQETMRVYKRVRAPTLEEWRDIVAELYANDADNPWNAPYIAKMLDYAETTHRRHIGDAAARWILHFAQDPAESPRLADRYVFGREFPELRESFEAACRRAIAWFRK